MVDKAGFKVLRVVCRREPRCKFYEEDVLHGGGLVIGPSFCDEGANDFCNYASLHLLYVVGTLQHTRKFGEPGRWIFVDGICPHRIPELAGE